ncbi:unnamed protein product [Rotaria sp. Silwood1]|nr:unnamed protein product [Rotaria sp. Silwood1]CAF1070582.1 unnamed protein product [Rotaria sp. Silwood1]CAF3410747.1 unnamed protein product [Rotaria sp. Silwood1]CAF4643777.1 unnamed protein product [Rotaria sp. Silwood1]
MPAANFANSSTLVSGVPSMTLHNAATAVQSGPYTKAQFQSTMEGSRTIKSSKDVEYILREYPAALELYRTGKYKVKVKCEANVERVILVEKKVTKTTTNDSTTTTTTNNNNQDNNQTVVDVSNKSDENKEVKHEQNSRPTPSRTQSQECVARTTSVTNGNNIVHATISSTCITNTNQPKVDHQRTPSNEREISVASHKKKSSHHRYHSGDIQHKESNHKYQGDKINRDYPKVMMPYVPQVIKPGNQWQQPRFPHPYYSNPALHQHQQQQQQQQGSNSHLPVSYLPQQNPRYQPPYYYRQRPTTPINIHPQQASYSLLPTPVIRKPNLHSMNHYPTSTRSVTNIMGAPPTIRTFHSNQQQQQLSSLRQIYQPQRPLPMNNSRPNMANEPLRNVMNNSNSYIEQQRGARNRTHSVDVSARNKLPVHISNLPQKTGTPTVEQYHHHHHRRHHHRPHPINNVENGKEQNITSKEQTSTVAVEKLTVRQLNDTFNRIDPSGRVPYTLLPEILQRYGIILSDNDITSAAKDLEYNLNEPISPRRLIHVLIKLGKITKSNQQQQQQQQQQQRQPVSPSILPEDREVTDIMTQRNVTNTLIHSSNQLNQ